ncbi:MAG: porin [Burkholderiales bacterium]|jgi:predicted porin
MKKSLLAVAVLGAMSGAAFAQVAPNNITLYGIVDAGLQSTRTTTQTAANVASTRATVNGLNSGIQSGNRWGLRGSEDLGGGLRANFQLESGFTLDNGALAQGSSTTANRRLCIDNTTSAVTSPGSASCPTGTTAANVATGVTPTNRLFGRAAWMGLSGGFGEVRLGRMAVYSSNVTAIADPFGNGFNNAAWTYLSTAAGPQRNDNTVLYLTPTMSGLQGGLYYSFGEVATPATASTAKDNWLGLGVTYTAGPLALGLAYDSVDSSRDAANANATTAAVTSQRDTKWLNLGASYNFGVATVRFGYVDQEAANRTDRKGYIIGANVPLAGGVLLASYQDGEDKTSAGVKTDYSRLSLGYTYNLSRRTNVYTAFSNGKSKEPTYTSSKDRQLSLGVRHTF